MNCNKEAKSSEEVQTSAKDVCSPVSRHCRFFFVGGGEFGGTRKHIMQRGSHRRANRSTVSVYSDPRRRFCATRLGPNYT